MKNSFLFNVPKVVDSVHERHGKYLKNKLFKALTTGSRSGRIYRINGQPHQASAPGEMPAKLSGNLAKSIIYRRSTKSLEFGETAFYAAFLELGTSKMSPRPHILRVIDESWPYLEKLYEKEWVK